jgi:hypothetical protein
VFGWAAAPQLDVLLMQLRAMVAAGQGKVLGPDEYTAFHTLYDVLDHALEEELPQLPADLAQLPCILVENSVFVIGCRHRMYTLVTARQVAMSRSREGQAPPPPGTRAICTTCRRTCVLQGAGLENCRNPYCSASTSSAAEDDPDSTLVPTSDGFATFELDVNLHLQHDFEAYAQLSQWLGIRAHFSEEEYRWRAQHITLQCLARRFLLRRQRAAKHVCRCIRGWKGRCDATRLCTKLAGDAAKTVHKAVQRAGPHGDLNRDAVHARAPSCPHVRVSAPQVAARCSCHCCYAT